MAEIPPKRRPKRVRLKLIVYPALLVQPTFRVSRKDIHTSIRQLKYIIPWRAVCGESCTYSSEGAF